MPYVLREVPARDDGRSRFAVLESPTGVSVTAAQAVRNAYLSLVVERQQEAEPLGELSKEIRLRKVVRAADGSGYTVADCPPILVVPDAKPTRTGRFRTSDLEAGALLDDAFLGGPSYHDAHDDALYDAALRVAEQEEMSGQDLIELNRAIQLLVLARAGVTTLRPADLPLLRVA